MREILCSCGQHPVKFEVKDHAGLHCFHCAYEAALLSVPGFVEMRSLEPWEMYESEHGTTN